MRLVRMEAGIEVAVGRERLSSVSRRIANCHVTLTGRSCPKHLPSPSPLPAKIDLQSLHRGQSTEYHVRPFLSFSLRA